MRVTDENFVGIFGLKWTTPATAGTVPIMTAKNLAEARRETLAIATEVRPGLEAFWGVIYCNGTPMAAMSAKAGQKPRNYDRYVLEIAYILNNK